MAKQNHEARSPTPVHTLLVIFHALLLLLWPFFANVESRYRNANHSDNVATQADVGYEK